MSKRSSVRSLRRAAVRQLPPPMVPVELCEVQLLCADATATDFDRTFADYIIHIPQGPPDPYHYQHNPTGRRDIELTMLQNDLKMSEMAGDYRAHEQAVRDEARKGLVTV